MRFVRMDKWALRVDTSREYWTFLGPHTYIALGLQSTLSKADTLGTKATVRFSEVSALERVQLQRYKCNSAGSGPNLLSGLESVRLERVDCIYNYETIMNVMNIVPAQHPTQ